MQAKLAGPEYPCNEKWRLAGAAGGRTYQVLAQLLLPEQIGDVNELASILLCYPAFGGPVIETRHPSLLVGDRHHCDVLGPLQQALIELTMAGRVGACEGHRLGQKGAQSLCERNWALPSGPAPITQQPQGTPVDNLSSHLESTNP